MQISASAIHELRMVIQHGARLLKRARPVTVQTDSPLLCVGCLRSRTPKRTAAITVFRGNASCMAHIL